MLANKAQGVRGKETCARKNRLNAAPRASPPAFPRPSLTKAILDWSGSTRRFQTPLFSQAATPCLHEPPPGSREPSVPPTEIVTHRPAPRPGLSQPGAGTVTRQRSEGAAREPGSRTGAAPRDLSSNPTAATLQFQASHSTSLVSVTWDL